MARPGARLCVRSAPRGPTPLLLLGGLALLGAARARAAAGGGFSLHPPYFNLAEGARIAASATCGEEAPARGAPRPTEDLYCKLVGGPVAGGDPNQTIQVSAAGAPGPERARARRGTPRCGPKSQRLGRRGGSAFRRTEGTRLGQRTVRPFGRAGRSVPTAGLGRPHARRVRRRWHGGGGGWCPGPGGPKSRDSGRAGLGCRRLQPEGRGRTRSAFPRDRLEPAGVDGTGMGAGAARAPRLRGHALEVLTGPWQRVKALPTGRLGTQWDPEGGKHHRDC